MRRYRTPTTRTTKQAAAAATAATGPYMPPRTVATVMPAPNAGVAAVLGTRIDRVYAGRDR